MALHDDVTGGLSPWGHLVNKRMPSGKRVGRPMRSSARRHAAHVGIGVVATVAVVGPISPVFHTSSAGATVISGQGTSFVTVPVQRIVDTRGGEGGPPGPFYDPTTFTVQIAGVGGIPNDGSVDSVAINLIAIPQADAITGAYIVAWPDGARPTASSLNFQAGVPIANGIIVPVADDGTIQIFTFGGTNVAIDLMGYFSSTALSGSTGAQGAVGATGQQGAAGAQGAQGAQGPQGAVGATGSNGAQGSAGAQGSVGDTGSQGLVGNTGPMGAQGAKGDTGAQGSNGNTGAQGSIGDTGERGAVGNTGAQGEIGCTGPQGNNGAQGAIGANGARGGVGTTGAQGETSSEGGRGGKGWSEPG